jgi:uncharacterized protein (DUF2236 family)
VVARRATTRRSLTIAPRSPERRTPDPGLFGPDSEGWRLNREAALLLVAGPRALLLQVAHPLIAEGVDQHSSFRADPWRRLSSTMTSSLRLLYGTTASAEGELEHLRTLHRAIRGPVRDAASREQHGPRYSARDPGLGFWVLATLIDSTIAGHEAVVGPVSRDARERFYAEGRLLARKLDIPAKHIPADLAAFEAYLREMLAPDGPVQVSPTARSIGQAIVKPPLGSLAGVTPGLDQLPAAASLLGAIPAAAYSWLYWPSLSLLPRRIRDGFRFEYGTREELVAWWLLAGWRLWRPRVPTALRWLPQARAAYRRIGLTSIG